MFRFPPPWGAVGALAFARPWRSGPARAARDDEVIADPRSRSCGLRALEDTATRLRRSARLPGRREPPRDRPYRGTAAPGTLEVDPHAKFLLLGSRATARRSATRSPWPRGAGHQRQLSPIEPQGRMAGLDPHREHAAARARGLRPLPQRRAGRASPRRWARGRSTSTAGSRDTFYRIHGTNDLSPSATRARRAASGCSTTT
jgi:hypothetical protein